MALKQALQLTEQAVHVSLTPYVMKAFCDLVWSINPVN